MKLQWSKPVSKNPSEILLEAGYHYFIDPNTQKGSYIMRVGRQFYPRYHVYIKVQGEATVVDLHIDQKQASYEGQHMHSGEYDGRVVEEEMARLERWFTYYSA